MCDYLSDIKNLPDALKDGVPQPNDTVCKNRCSPGSQCFCLEDSSIWILGKDSDQWIKKKNTFSSGGSFGAGGDTVESIPFSSIQSLF